MIFGPDNGPEGRGVSIPPPLSRPGGGQAAAVL
jgi:hypothetical protein